MGKWDATRSLTCSDKAGDCEARAKKGECSAKPEVMVGTDGDCRKTCKDCIPCLAGDILCARANMRGRFKISLT